MRKLVGLVVLAMMSVSLPIAAAGAAPLPGLECGQTITTSVRLTHDLICPQGFLATTPSYNGTTPLTPITVDLAGHRLGLISPSGPALCPYYRAPLVFRGSDLSCPITSGGGVALTILNGTVGGSVASIEGAGLHISRVHVRGGVLFSAVDTFPDDVSDSRVDGPVVDWTALVTMRRNMISGGISTSDTWVDQNLTITNNLIVGSPAAGILIGVEFEYPDVSGVIAGNIITHSAGSGISAAGSNLKGLLIEHNWLMSNEGDGVTLGPAFLPGAATATLTGNVAIANRGHGFHLDPTIRSGTWPPNLYPQFIDGGHNVAFLNRTTPQCIGLTCTPQGATP